MPASSRPSATVLAFRWMLIVAAVAIVAFWFLYQTIDPAYIDPLPIRVVFSAFLVSLFTLTFLSRVAQRMIWHLALLAAISLTAYIAWLGSLNGLDLPWTVGVLATGSAATMAVPPYAREVRQVVGAMGGLVVTLIGTLFAAGAPLDQVVMVGSYFVVLSAASGLAAVAQVRTRQALRQGRDDLRARGRLLRTVIDAIPEHVYVKDREGRCLIRNRFSAAAMGYDDPEEAVGLTVFDTSEDPLVAAAYWAEEDRVMATGEPDLDHEEPYAFDGVRGWIVTSRIPLRDDAGDVIGLVGVTRDVTDQKRARQAILEAKEAAERRGRELTEQQEILQSLFDAIPDAIFVVDADDRFVAVNRGTLNFMGEDSRDHVIGKTRVEVLSPEIAEEYRRYDDAAIASGERIHRMENDYVTPDGTVVTLETTRVAIRDADGNAVRVVGVARDVTAQRAAQAQLLDAKEAAEAATRAKSEFLANMSHEIRTPMNGVIGMTSLLLDTPLDREQRDFVETIRMSGDALLTIINDILDFSKIEAGMLALEVQPFEIRTCVEAALDLVAQSAAQKGVELAYLVEDGVPRTVRGDVTRVRQVLVNLLSNAVKFTNEGSVCVRVDAIPPDPAADTVCQVQFSVEDTGIGIAPDKLDLVFESFSQADASTTRQFGGTGLGLTICRRLVSMMGGEMGVESEVGQGSTFRFSVEAEVAPSERRVFLRSEQPALQGRRVLIVDDNDVNREILSRLSTRWRMVADAVSSGVDAIDAVEASLAAARPYDLILLDMQMPGMDGLEAARAIRERMADAPPVMVMLTSIHREGSLREDARAVGIASVLYKPTKPSQLYDVLIDAFEGRPSTETPSTPAEPRPMAWIARPTPTATLRILLAEDNVVNQKVAVRLLDRLGYSADVVSDGAEALAEVERRAGFGEAYDIVFMDVQMPVMDGLEATRAIQTSATIPNPPYIIALTANAMEGDREACLAAGTDDYLAKPVQLDAIREAIDRALVQRRIPQPATPTPEAGRVGG